MKNARALFLLPIALLFLPTAYAATPTTGTFHASFSFTCNMKVSFCAGVIIAGSCTFAGGGTTADCQTLVSNPDGKLGLPSFGPVELHSVGGWAIGTGSMLLPTKPNLPAFFAVGPQTLTARGPGASATQAIFPSTFTCPSKPTPSLNFLCDSGIPAVPGHYTWADIPFAPSIPPQPGIHGNVQVTQVG